MSIPIEQKHLRKLIRSFLKEDVGRGDITTELIVPAHLQAKGEFVVHEECVVAGLEMALETFKILDPRVRVKLFYRDGQVAPKGKVIAMVGGKARALLTGERVALNLLQRLSGVASETRRYVEALRRAWDTENAEKTTGRTPYILDTRKTTPGWRVLEKYAVRCGGGKNHRMGLWDAVLIKDNHIAIAGGVREAVHKVQCARGQVSATTDDLRSRRDEGRGQGRIVSRRRAGRVAPIEVEVTNRSQLNEALRLGVDRILLDNMSPRDVRKCVDVVRKSPGGEDVIVECSGGISLATVGKYATTGVDWISVGALTHSARAVDVSFGIQALSAKP
jgi:nicotinate-nucleotide pyrophosphorylase (carboxylating)